MSPTPESDAPRRPEPPGGREWTIRRDGHEASVLEVGATLRRYDVEGRAVVAGFPPEQVRPDCRGAVLAPWPNRVADGRYRFPARGPQRRLALSEPERGNALHGLVSWLPWSPVEVADDAVTLGVTLHPQQGWDWTLDLTITYALDGRGLVVTPVVRNLSATAAPFGFAAHPYLTAGEAGVDELTLTVPAGRHQPVDPDRLLPTGPPETVAGATDLRDGPSLAGRSLDTAFTDLAAPEGTWHVDLTCAATRRTTRLWAEAQAFPWLQVFTGDALPEPLRRRSGVALEAMTCPPGALDSGVDLVVLEPGARWAGTFGIEPRRA